MMLSAGHAISFVRVASSPWLATRTVPSPAAGWPDAVPVSATVARATVDGVTVHPILPGRRSW